MAWGGVVAATAGSEQKQRRDQEIRDAPRESYLMAGGRLEVLPVIAVLLPGMVE